MLSEGNLSHKGTSDGRILLCSSCSPRTVWLGLILYSHSPYLKVVKETESVIGQDS